MERTACALAAALAGFGLVACGLTTIRPREMEPRLSYTGFSFARPPSESWFIRKAEATRTQVIVRHDALPGENHDAFVAFRLYPVNFDLDEEELARWTRDEDLRAKTVVAFRSYALEPSS